MLVQNRDFAGAHFGVTEGVQAVFSKADIFSHQGNEDF